RWPTCCCGTPIVARPTPARCRTRTPRAHRARDIAWHQQSRQQRTPRGAARRAPETRPAGCAQHPPGCFIKPLDEVIMPTADTNVNGRSVLDDQDQRLRDGADCLAAALDYLARGWPVLSLCPPDHVGVRLVGHTHCDSPGKAPWHRWAEYQS